MAFTDVQQALLNSRRQREQTEQALFAAREKEGRIRREQDALNRFTRDGQSRADERLRELRNREKALGEEIAGLKDELSTAEKLEAGHLNDFLSFTDPTAHLDRLDDRYPILLFPLRIETRFKEVEQPGGESKDQLWVRVYPDEIAVDTFEPMLSENEVRNARRYWKSIWRAGRIESGERAAWRSLVSNHGSGRARWIEQHYRPLNESDRPEKDSAGEIILVIATEASPPEAERGAIETFWEAYWRAGDNAPARQSARDALVDTLGEARAGRIEVDTVPFNLTDAPAEGVTRDGAVLQVRWLIFPDPDSLDTQFQSWTRAPRVNVLPERLVLMAFDGDRDEPAIQSLGEPIPSTLAVGPDPSVPEAGQMRVEDGELIVNDDLKWMVDFERAVAKGLGFKVDLTPEQAGKGFDRLFVLGVRMASDRQAGKDTVESLVRHHHASRKGFSIVPQGTPTNNTEKQSSGYSWREDADVSFDRYFTNSGAQDPQGWFDKTDGRWLAEFLGIDPFALRDTGYYDATDQRDAKAMNTVLWPATLGYFMETMMSPVFDESTIEQTGHFFRHFVSGRGMLPAVRVGKQPYGILPVTPFSRMRWFKPRISVGRAETEWGAFGNHFGYLQALYDTLMRIDGEWSTLRDRVAHVGKEGDAHQILLDVLGLHPASVEFYNRYAQSFNQLFNTLNLKGLGGMLVSVLVAAGYVQSGLDLLGRFGYDADAGDDEATPDILRKFFFGRSDRLKGPLVDDVPLSETDPIRAYTDSGDNYLQWLIDAAHDAHDTLRRQNGFIDGRPPTALLYLMLHHALDLNYLDSSLRLHRSAGVLDDDQLRTARLEPEFIHVQEAGEDAGSRWRYLYKSDVQITGQADRLIGDHIPSVIASAPEAFGLRNQLQALERLKDLPTARLERCFVEHLDTCSYRLDAWLFALVQYQLALMRGLSYEYEQVDGAEHQGTYIGAYGWLEAVRPDDKQLAPAQLDPELAAVFADPEHPLKVDRTNAGYIHAPSANHAVTAAILRNGYLANADQDNSDTLAVNLSSERVRLALSMIEGIRNGQSLSALLGYQLERGLHDRHDVEVDAFIFDLRKVFPLTANHISTTRTDEFESIDEIEARNVVDGLALIEQVRTSEIKTYPFGVDDLPDAGEAQKTTLNEEVERILDINDAVADLAVAEGVHQAVQGNHERAAATLDTYSKGRFPPTPDVVKTPRSGVTLTHRVGIHFEVGLDPAAAENTTPRSKAEPAVNRWLKDMLPPMDTIACVAEFFDHRAGSTRREPVTMDEPDWQPIDLLYTANLEDEQALSTLDERITTCVIGKFDPRPDADIRIHYTEPVAGKLSLFELAPLLAGLRTLITRSRALTGADVVPATEGGKGAAARVHLDRSRVTEVRGALVTLKGQLDGYIAGLQTPFEAEDTGALIAGVDSAVSEIIALFDKIGEFAAPEASTGFVLTWRHQQFAQLLGKLETLQTRWIGKLTQFDQLIGDYDALPAGTPDADKFNLLLKAERRVSASTTKPLPAAPDDLRDDLVDNRRNAFQNKLDQIGDALQAMSLGELYSAAGAVATGFGDFDLETFDIESEKSQLLVFAADLLTGARNLQKDVDKRLNKVTEQLQAADKAADARSRVDALLAAAAAMLGEQFSLVPEFELDEDQANEWQSAYDDRDKLLTYQTDDLQAPFPVDTWLYGTARVREKMSALESTAVLVESLTEGQLPLEPVQFPYREQDHWLALEYPDKTTDGETFVIDEDKLLYTASYAAGFDKNARQCGLLIDEWTEVIPTVEETTGLAFHYDRPNAEPAQTLLLATPADFQGQWQWRDLVDTLHETLDWAQKRAIEPGQIDDTDYARILPALVSTVTTYPVTAALNLAMNNAFYQFGADDDE